MANMKTSAKIATGLSAVAVAAILAFAVPAIAAPSGQAASPRPASEPTQAPTPAAQPVTPNAANGGNLPKNCTTWSAIRFAPSPEGATTTTVSLDGPSLVDTGATELAAGSAKLDEGGHVTSYTVADGDSAIAIGERFCVDYITVMQFNHIYPSWSMQPGDVLSLSVDESVPFPIDAP